MKKIKFLAMMMLAGTLTFTSCSDDDETVPAPTISFSGGTGVTVPLTNDTNVVFNATLTAEGEISVFTITEKKIEADGTEHATAYDPTDVTGDAKGKTSFVYNFDNTFDATDFTDANGTYVKIQYVFSVTDKEGASITKIYTATLESASTAGPINTYSAVTMGSWTATEGSYYASVDGTVYTESAVTGHEAEIDFVFYVGNANAATLCAPNNTELQAGGSLENEYVCKNWTSPNATKFGTDISGNITWANVTDDTEIVNYAGNLTATASTNLANTNVIPFETVSGKKGFILVTAVDPTYASGSITIEVKVQQ